MSIVTMGLATGLGSSPIVTFGLGIYPVRIPGRICVTESTASLIVSELGYDSVQTSTLQSGLIEVIFLSDNIYLSDAVVPIVIDEITDTMSLLVSYDSITATVSVLPITITEDYATVTLWTSSEVITAITLNGEIQVTEEVISCDN